MAYLRPSAFQRRIFNRLAMTTGLAGSETLEARGRRSGKLIQLPVIPVEVEGRTYLASPRGESEWVRNLRASGEGTLRQRGRPRRFTATEVLVEERGPILEAYQSKAGRTVTGYFKELSDDKDHPVFRIDLADEQ